MTDFVLRFSGSRSLYLARSAGAVRFPIEARVLWWETCARLSEPSGGLAGAFCARGEAHIVRLALDGNCHQIDRIGAERY